jgi:hypothetical protein
LDISGLDCRQVPRRETTPLGAAESSRLIYRTESLRKPFHGSRRDD